LYQHANIQRPLTKHQTPLVMAINILLTFGYMTGIYWLSSIPGDIDSESPLLSSIILWTPPAIQNLAHIPLFGMLAFLWHRSLNPLIKNSRLLLGTAFLLTTGFGMADELHQLQVPGRYASLTDMALDALGAFLTIWILSREQNKAANP